MTSQAVPCILRHGGKSVALWLPSAHLGLRTGPVPRSTVRMIEQSDTFRRAFGKLPPWRRDQVARTIGKLGFDPHLPGLRVEKLHRARSSIRSVRVAAGDRLIFEVVAPDKLLLIAVGTHQEIDRLIDRTSVLRAITIPGDEIRPDDFGEVSVFQRHDHIDASQLSGLWQILETARAFDSLGSVQQIIEHMMAGDTSGKARPSQLPGGGGAPVNVIPFDSSTPRGQCTPVLLAFCFDGDSLDSRLHEIERHVTLDCRDTRVVILVTTQWQPKVWKKKYEEVSPQFGRAGRGVSRVG